jgi:hypothetical protein
MDSKLGMLANRIRSQIDADEARRDREEEARKQAAAARRETDAKLARQKAQGQAARAALLDDIAAFAEAVGHLELAREALVVSVAFRSRAVRFEPDGDFDRIALVVPGQTPRNHFLGRDEQGEWEVVLDEGTKIRRLSLAEGLEEVMRTMLEVPIGEASDGDDAPATAARKGRRGRGATPGGEIKELKEPLG